MLSTRPSSIKRSSTTDHHQTKPDAYLFISNCQSYEVRHPGRASGSDKIRYCQSSAYSASGKGPGELHVASGAPPGFHTSSTSASSAPRSSRKYQVGELPICVNKVKQRRNNMI